MALNLPSSIGIVDSLQPDLVLTVACTERLRNSTNDNTRIQDLASPSVNIPLGLRKIYLDSIELTLTISAMLKDEAGGKPIKTELSFSSETESSMLIDENESDICLFEDGVDGRRGELDQQPYTRQGHFSSYQHIPPTDPEKSWQGSTIISDHAQKPFSSLSNHPHTPFPRTSANNDYDNSTPSSTKDAWVEHVSELVIAALRGTFGGNDRCLARGVRALNDSKISTLAAIAPALFNPGYQQVSTCGVARNINSHVMASN